MSRNRMVLMGRRSFLKSLSLATVSSVLLFGLSPRVRADVPDVQVIENISQDTQGMIRLQIRHANPRANHYIDVVEVDVEGQVQALNLAGPQNTEIFTEDLDIGPIQGTPNVKTRAHCTVHGWSAWSDQITIPEFPTGIVLALVSLSAALALLSRTKKD